MYKKKLWIFMFFLVFICPQEAQLTKTYHKKMTLQTVVVHSHFIVVAERLSDAPEESTLKIIDENFESKDRRDYPRDMQVKQYSFKITESLKGLNDEEIGPEIKIMNKQVKNQIRNIEWAHKQGMYKSYYVEEYDPSRALAEIKKGESVILFLIKDGDSLYLVCDETIEDISKKAEIMPADDGKGKPKI